VHCYIYLTFLWTIECIVISSSLYDSIPAAVFLIGAIDGWGGIFSLSTVSYVAEIRFNAVFVAIEAVLIAFTAVSKWLVFCY
jgi:hypothetical protein